MTAIAEALVWLASLLLACLILLVTALAGPTPAVAQTWPERTIKLIVPFPAGGPTDVAARLVVEHMTARLRQSIVVENVAGAGGRTGSKMVARAAPDGYTLMIGGTNLNAVVPALYAKLDYDPLRDIVPVASIANDSQVMVITPSLPARTLSEFIAYARANPGKLAGGSVMGIGAHFSIVLLNKRAGIDVRFVPYKGGAPSIQDVMGGHIQMSFNNKSVLLSLIQDGKVRAVGVTSDERWPELPGVETFREAGYPGFPNYNWYGLMAPAGTPQPIVVLLNATINDILRSGDAKPAFDKLGIDPRITTPEEFAAVLARQAQEWSAIVRETGIQVE